MRRTVAIGIVAAATLVACGTSPRGAGIEPRYVAVHNALAAMGLAQVGPIQEGALAEGREVRLRLDLPAQCSTVVALGGAGVRDLDVALRDADDKPVAQDTTHDAEAVVRTCAEKPGSYTLIVTMRRGAGDWTVATWAGAAPAPVASGAASSSTAGADGGTCESPIALAPGTVVGNTRRGESEQAGSCVGSSSSEIVYRLELPRRQRVTLEVDAQFDSVLYVRRDDCAQEEAEIACNDDASTGAKRNATSNRSSRIDETLDAGTYYVFVDGYGNEAGSYRLTAQVADVPALADACRQAQPLALQKVTRPLSGAFDNAHGSCGDDAKGPDLVHRLDMPARARVRITSSSADFSPVVHVRSRCADEKSEVGCSASGFAAHEATFVGLEGPGPLTVFADSSEKDARGAMTLEAETAPENGSGVPGDTCADAIRLSPTEKRVEGDTFRARDEIGGRCTGQGAPDVLYRFELARRSRVTAHFIAQEGTHVFVLARTCGDRASELACTANLDETLAPGIYSLAVDGGPHEGLGRYAFAFQARDVSAQENGCRSAPALAAGQKVSATTAGAGDKFTTSCGGREDAQTSADRVYKLTVATRSRVQLLLETPTWDGVLALRKSCIDPPQSRGARATEVACNNDYQDSRHSKIETTLDPGTYFVVVDGHQGNSEGPFSLEYRLLR